MIFLSLDKKSLRINGILLPENFSSDPTNKIIGHPNNAENGG